MGSHTGFTGTVTSKAKHNSGATVLFGGNVASNSFVTNAITLAQVDYHDHYRGTSKIVVVSSGDHLRVGKAITGTIGVMTAGKYVIMGNCSQLAGTANTFLNSPQTVGLDDIHQQSTHRTQQSRTAGYNYNTGRFLTTPNIVTDSFGTDTAATLNMLSLPQLVYLVGKTPTTTTYKSRRD